MKSITEYLDYLYKFERTGIKYDLSNITALLKHLGNPHHKIKFIHVAGTNGKGATVSFIASILQEHNYRTGLFTSPHIIKFNERIRINGKTISDSYVKSFIKDNIKLFKKIKPSFFEVNTAMAFKYFYDKRVDIAVIECGLGGRLDSTNVIRPGVSVITQIGLDHTEFLGNTLQKIAIEKLGIVKKGINVVVSDNNKSLKKLFHKKISKNNLYYLDDIIKINTDLKLNIPLSGKYQARNALASVITTELWLEEQNIQINLVAVKRGLKNVVINTGYHGRYENIKYKGRNIILDVSHNSESVDEVIKSQNIKYDVIVFGMMKEKNYKSAIKYFINSTYKLILTQPDYYRSVESVILFNDSVKQANGKKGLGIYLTRNVKEAIESALILTKPKQSILVIGSFFLVSDVIKVLKLQEHFR